MLGAINGYIDQRGISNNLEEISISQQMYPIHPSLPYRYRPRSIKIIIKICCEDSSVSDHLSHDK